MHWRLDYPDGSTQREKPGGSTIRAAQPGAIRLVADGVDVVQVVPLGEGWRPVWYRNRSMGLDGTGTRTDATVFGRVRNRDSQLWAYMGGDIVDCPLEQISVTALETF